MPGGFQTRVDVEGLDRARRIAAKVREMGADTRPLLEIAGSVLLNSILKRFDTGRGPGGIPWAQTRRQRGRAVGKSGPVKQRILVDTGDLQSSFRFAVRPGEVEVGSDGLKNPVKAVANQFGSHRQSVVLPHFRTINSAFGVPLASPKQQRVRAHGRMTNLPARPMVGVDQEDRTNVEDAWLDHLKGLFDV